MIGEFYWGRAPSAKCSRNARSTWEIRLPCRRPLCRIVRIVAKAQTIPDNLGSRENDINLMTKQSWLARRDGALYPRSSAPRTSGPLLQNFPLFSAQVGVPTMIPAKGCHCPMCRTERQLNASLEHSESKNARSRNCVTYVHPSASSRQSLNSSATFTLRTETRNAIAAMTNFSPRSCGRSPEISQTQYCKLF